MNFSFDVVDDTDVFKASIVKNKGPKMTYFLSDTRSDEAKTLPDHLEDPDPALALVFPTIMARLDVHSTPTPLQILKGLGEGTMGRVFLTRDPSTSKVFALKVFNKSHVLACEEEKNTVIERNCLLETGDNPFTVHLRASFQDETRLYMLLDFCVGGDLATELARWAGEMPMGSVVYNAAHLAEGIASLHELGIIHRDLKPENILLTARGHIKISDFGSAVRVPSPESWVEATTQFGTAAYVPPEVYCGRHNCSIDWWCLGIIIYEMVLGKHPFLSEGTHRGGDIDMEDLAEAICNGEYQLREEDVEPSTRRIIRGLLRADPTRRYGAEEVRKSKFFAGWDWDSVRNLEYQAPHLPVVNPYDATCNFDPEFNDMSLEDDEWIEGVESLDDPFIFSGFDRYPTVDDTSATSSENVLTHTYTQHPPHLLADTNIPSSHPSPLHHNIESNIYSQASTADRLHVIVGRGEQHIEGVETLDGALFPGFDRSLTFEDTSTTSPENVLMTHTQRTSYLLADTNGQSASPFHYGTETDMCSQPSTADNLHITVGRGEQHRNTWKMLRTYFAAVTQFKRGVGSKDGDIVHSRNL